MKSSSGAYFVGLDHLRAAAALLVFTWHFMHGTLGWGQGWPIPFGYAPDPLIGATFAEGHWGVALFMTLSGYLFAGLLDGHRIHYGWFFWNRALRLLPLLVAVLALVGIQEWRHGRPIPDFLVHLARGLVFPELDNGGWSITTEIHFYLLLPLLLAFARAREWALPAVVVAAILFRAVHFLQAGQVQDLAYWTIFGRLDDFVLGILAFQHRDKARGRHALMALCAAIFLAAYYLFANAGGFYGSETSPVWIVLPTIEASFCAVLIAWYDQSFQFGSSGFSGVLARIGTYSYSIYLLHPFLVFRAAPFINRFVDLRNFYICLIAAVLSFLIMALIGALSFHAYEAFFLRFRRKYVLPDALATMTDEAPLASSA